MKVSDAIREVTALNQLHAEIMLALVLPDFEDRHDVRMVEVRRGLCLDIKAPHVPVRGQVGRQNHLDGHDALQACLPGLVYHAHATPRQLADQLVVAEIA